MSRKVHPATWLVGGLVVGVLIACLWARSWVHNDGLFWGFAGNGASIESAGGNLSLWMGRGEGYFGLKGIIFMSDYSHFQTDGLGFEQRVFGTFESFQTPESIYLAIPHWVFVLLSISCGIGLFFWRKENSSKSS